MQTTAPKLTSWSARLVGSVRDKLAISRVLLLKLDTTQENRMLTPHEYWLRRQIKQSYLGLASLTTGDHAYAVCLRHTAK
jgi:hypothetical protein